MMIKKEILEQFGSRVRTLRQRKGLSQEELAFRAKVHRTYMGGIERGERNPSLLNITRISDALGVGLLELFNYTDQNINSR
ncbi:MAG: helix-turn-helix transcriptional regulator [Dehalococcoidales bacterium]|jgi:transcriptional regulator with XRE-family HTH domain|nr:helix-turn-helix transcriptional regulator [Dehalococcoidales bacterium]